ncbi:hypothetical protein C7974DRAFT_433114 [Boeremia exigua]|uniref:uncharacterized protein n=1 Tax=Boeremia exigua TaxID=749465 RepID=UPI001E8D55B2|nr:uncharacterized protein C7974DRAFT_433114 [Boeremia exigua]KAH6632900.1 hypothetical protein C7974DRAFT_433114 [Boeremia exigua]
MASLDTAQTKSHEADARSAPSPDEMQRLAQIEVYDRTGSRKPLGDFIKAKRSVLIFTRHFWCLNCQAYVRAISKQIPPSSLPVGTQILIISNGSYQPINTYISMTSSAYPVYTDPTLQLHSILKFKSVLREASKDEKKRDYMENEGTLVGRIFGGIVGAVTNIQHTPYIGPKALNGGEVIIATDGSCEYIYRMQNTVDHVDVSELARIIGVRKESM